MNDVDGPVFDGFIAFIAGIVLTAAVLSGCAQPSPASGDAGACPAACAHESAVGCADPDPDVVAQCVHACEFAAQHGWLHPEKIATATRDELRAMGVRCPQ